MKEQTVADIISGPRGWNYKLSAAAAAAAGTVLAVVARQKQTTSAASRLGKANQWLPSQFFLVHTRLFSHIRRSFFFFFSSIFLIIYGDWI